MLLLPIQRENLFARLVRVEVGFVLVGSLSLFKKSGRLLAAVVQLLLHLRHHQQLLIVPCLIEHCFRRSQEFDHES